MAMKKLYLEQQKLEVLKPLSLEPKVEKENIMGAFASSIQAGMNLKRLSQQSIPRATEVNNTTTINAHDRSANSTQQNMTKDANNTSVELRVTGDHASQEIDRNSNEGGYQGKKKAIVHNCVLEILYRDELFSPNADSWMVKEAASRSLVEGCRVSYFYTLSQLLLQIDYKLRYWHHLLLVGSMNHQKQLMMSGRFNKIEELLYTCDIQFLAQRIVLVEILKSEETGMEDRERGIKDQLKHIAQLEMEKGIEEDKMLNMTLKAIEIVNIADMASEKDQLE